MSTTARALVSLAVILLSAAAIVLAVRFRPPPPPPPRDQIVPVFQFRPEEVRSIRLATPEGRLEAERSAGHWQVRSLSLPARGDPAPSETPDATAVDEALTALAGELARLPEVGRFPLGDEPPSAFGLDTPFAEIAIALDSGALVKLEIGDRTATGAGFYARAVPSDDVIQIGSLIFNEIAAALYRLRAFAQASA